jgi:ribose transport system substrate-binding protein
LSIPPGNGLYYILNDEEEGGRLAAQRVGLILHGRGSIALLGIDPAITGVMIRARSFERVLSSSFPDIHIVDRRPGSFSRQHEQQMTDEVLQKRKGLSAIVALNWTSAYEAVSNIESHPGEYSARVIAFDPGGLPFIARSLDSIILQDTRAMGEEAVRLIASRLQGRPVASVIILAPILVTRENLETDRVRRLTTLTWRPETAHGGAWPGP